MRIYRSETWVELNRVRFRLRLDHRPSIYNLIDSCQLTVVINHISNKGDESWPGNAELSLYINIVVSATCRVLCLTSHRRRRGVTQVGNRGRDRAMVVASYELIARFFWLFCSLCLLISSVLILCRRRRRNCPTRCGTSRSRNWSLTYLWEKAAIALPVRRRWQVPSYYSFVNMIQRTQKAIVGSFRP